MKPHAFYTAPLRIQIMRLFACLMVLSALSVAARAQAVSPGGAHDQPVVLQLLDAIALNDYPRFISQGTPAFANLGQAQFTQVSAAIAPRLQQGYRVEHMGNLRQQGLDISVWKVSFQDQGDDLLATLNVQNGRIGGFFLR